MAQKAQITMYGLSFEIDAVLLRDFIQFGIGEMVKEPEPLYELSEFISERIKYGNYCESIGVDPK